MGIRESLKDRREKKIEWHKHDKSEIVAERLTDMLFDYWALPRHEIYIGKAPRGVPPEEFLHEVGQRAVTAVVEEFGIPVAYDPEESIRATGYSSGVKGSPTSLSYPIKLDAKDLIAVFTREPAEV